MRLIKKLIKALHIIGYSWITIVGIYILLQYVRVLLTDGLPLDQRVLSFLNIWNIFFALIALMPGLICILISDFFYRNNNGIG
jgi:TM2 domain-containing membrane protein YozV